ncbi:MAG: hypothetical protein Q8O01_05045 [Candidatus Omnitrophota bacterium]|nr:hypothetical protein [Candidatus Omnitrophota bacterium]
MPKLRFQKIALKITLYREGNKFIAYSPALNISTCGDSQFQAQERFEELLEIFLEEIHKMDTCEDVLLECGWKKVGHAEKRWQPPIFVGQTDREIRIPCPA